MNIVRIILSFWISLVVVNAQGAIRFEHINLDDGLSQNSVRASVKDHQGYMWFSTDDGLNRFNGYEFKVFRPKADNPYSISSSSVSSLFVDNDGTLWVGTWTNGLNRFDAKTERFEQYIHDDLEPNSISDHRVNKIIDDGQQGLWIATANGLNHFDKNKRTFKRYFHQANNPTSLGNNDVRDVHIDKLGRLWIATYGGGLNLYIPHTDTFERFNPAVSQQQSISYFVSSIASDDKFLWIGDDVGVTSVNLATLAKNYEQWPTRFYTFESGGMSISVGDVRDIVVDQNQKVWLATSQGGMCQLGSFSQFTCYRHSLQDRTSISRDDIWDLYLDDQQVLWVGTQSGGVNKVNLVAGGFNHQFNRDEKSGISDSNVWAFLEGDNGEFWVGTERGLNRIVDNKVRYFVHDVSNEHSLSHNYIHALAMNQGQLWVGTHDGLNRMDVAKGTFERIDLVDTQQQAHGSADINTMSVLDNGRMWIGTGGGGLFYFDPKSNTSVQYRTSVNNSQSIGGNYIRDTKLDAQQNLWVGTRNNGLNFFNSKTGIFTRYRHDSKDSHSISSDHVASIAMHSSGDVFIGTDNGLNRLNIATEKFERFGQEHGLANNQIRGIIEDERGNLWVSSNYGLSYFDYKTKTFINYDERDGLQSNEFKPSSYYKSPKGEMFFGGVNGYNHFYSKDLVLDKTPPKVVFTDFLLANRSVSINPEQDQQSEQFSLPLAINFLPHLVLGYSQNLMTVVFSGLHYANPSKNNYAYRLLGFDDDWIYTDANNRRATYSNLPDGDYVLEVKASNRDGIWTTDSKQLTIEVLPPPWRTWWAYIGYFLIGMLPIFVYVRAQRREIYYKYEQNIKLEKTVEKRTAQLEKRNQQIEQQNREIIDAQHQIVQSEKMASLGTLTAGVAHEVNNPNNFVYVSAQNLLEDVDKAQAFFMRLAGDELDEDLKQAFTAQFAPIKEHVATIKEGSKRIQTIVKDLRTFTQLDNSERNEVVLTDLVSATVNLAKSRYLKLVTFDCQFAEEPVLLCYPAQLNQVFMNLIVNACHAIEEKINLQLSQQETELKGRITILSYIVRAQAVIEFVDNGIGFDEKLKEKLCEPFYTTKKVGKGTGLGLSISYGIIQKHHGRLLIGSKPGVGSSFKVVLPLRN